MRSSRSLVFGLTLCLAILLAWRLELVREPELLLADGNRVVLATLPLPDGGFQHVFIHSVHKTPVSECFRVEAKEDGAVMHLYELRYQSQGVGMPSDAEGGYRLEGNTFILAMDRSFQELQIMVSPVLGHGIVARGTFTPFINYKQPGQRLVLTARMTRHIRLRR